MTFELSTLVTDFFVVHLAAERNASQHTVYAYRDTMKLLLRFAAADRKRTIDRLTLEDLSAEVVLRFLSDLESRRRNSISTRKRPLGGHPFLLPLRPQPRTRLRLLMPSGSGNTVQVDPAVHAGLSQ